MQDLKPAGNDLGKVATISLSCEGRPSEVATKKELEDFYE